ncbi:MAG TPA: class I SAM-dependent RNA methyltransferase [Azospirillaceae bacterium]|nr:class I SAM-dependent RNA methyltransferase [Azospirillaceae bacterium]
MSRQRSARGTARAHARPASRTDLGIVEVEVSAIGARGDGLAEHAGRRLYLPLTAPGDRVRARVGAARGDGFEAEVVETLAPAPGRAAPACAHFGACGGCALQHIEDAAYGAWKRDRVVEALARAGLDGVPVDRAVRTPAGDRRRAMLAARKAGGRVLLGFNERRSHRIVDVAACPVLLPALADCLAPLRRLLGTLLDDGQALDVAATLLDDGLDLVLTGPLDLDLAARERLAAFAEDADLARLSWRPRAGAPAEPLVHRREGVVRFAGVSVVLPPGGFLQASRSGEAALQRLVLAGVGGAGRVADLFAGCGTFAIPLALGTATVHAVEGDMAASAALTGASTRLPRLSVERRDLDRDPIPAKALGRFDAVVFDPPRAGAAAQATEMAGSGVPVVVGVSCNPATFARDARTLVDGGYVLERVTPVDQFLWSPHVELVGVFRRN